MDVQLIKENARVLKSIKRQQEQAEISGTIEYQYIQVKTVINYYFRKSIKQLMLITNANVKSKTREIKAKKERENRNKRMFLSLY